jgi:site-specific recombinase XerD
VGRTTVYTRGLTDDYDKVNPKNQTLLKEFLEYCRAIDRAETTIENYQNQIKIFFCWNLNNNENKFFVDLKKRDFIRFFGYARTELGSSPARVSGLKSALSSMSNMLENTYEDVYPTFRNAVRGIETAAKAPVREKTIIDEKQVKMVLDELVAKGKYQLACYLALLANSGSRKSEMIQMKVSFFNESHEVFGGFMYLTDTMRTKGRGSLGKMLPRYCIKEGFKQYLDLWMQERAKKNIDSIWLFVVCHDGKWEQAKISTANSYAETLSKMFGVDFYNHCLRHAFVTSLKRAHLDDEAVRAVLGWESTELVRVYNDIPEEEYLEKYFDANVIKVLEPTLKIGKKEKK